MWSTEAPGGRGSEDKASLEEVKAENEIAPEDLNRMCELLATWALRRGRQG
jgi:hypothetical protein